MIKVKIVERYLKEKPEIVCSKCGDIVRSAAPMVKIKVPYCGNCGKRIEDAEQKYCGYCGQELDWD